MNQRDAFDPRKLGLAGPRNAQPFPTTGRIIELVTCPTCRGKNLPLWYAPYERAYPSQCLACGQKVLYKPKHEPLKELLLEGVYKNPYIRPKRDGRILNATRLYEEARVKQDLGRKRYVRK